MVGVHQNNAAGRDPAEQEVESGERVALNGGEVEYQNVRPDGCQEREDMGGVRCFSDEIEIWIGGEERVQGGAKDQVGVDDGDADNGSVGRRLQGNGDRGGLRRKGHGRFSWIGESGGRRAEGGAAAGLGQRRERPPLGRCPQRAGRRAAELAEAVGGREQEPVRTGRMGSRAEDRLGA